MQYLYDNGVLINKFGIREEISLENLERELSLCNAAGLQAEISRGRYDRVRFSLDLLREFHHRLFHDLYDWAGDPRRCEISKDGSQFCFSEHIPSYALTIFPLLDDERPDPQDLHASALRIAHWWSEINALHPFRDGNGRATRLFIQAWAHSRGLLLDYSKMDGQSIIQAGRKAFDGDIGPLAALTENSLSPLVHARTMQRAGLDAGFDR